MKKERKEERKKEVEGKFETCRERRGGGGPRAAASASSGFIFPFDSLLWLRLEWGSKQGLIERN